MLYGEVPQSGGFKFTNRNPPKQQCCACRRRQR